VNSPPTLHATPGSGRAFLHSARTKTAHRLAGVRSSSKHTHVYLDPCIPRVHLFDFTFYVVYSTCVKSPSRITPIPFLFPMAKTNNATHYPPFRRGSQEGLGKDPERSGEGSEKFSLRPHFLRRITPSYVCLFSTQRHNATHCSTESAQRVCSSEPQDTSLVAVDVPLDSLCPPFPGET